MNKKIEEAKLRKTWNGSTLYLLYWWYFKWTKTFWGWKRRRREMIWWGGEEQLLFIEGFSFIQKFSSSLPLSLSFSSLFINCQLNGSRPPLISSLHGEFVYYAIFSLIPNPCHFKHFINLCVLSSGIFIAIANVYKAKWNEMGQWNGYGYFMWTFLSLNQIYCVILFRMLGKRYNMKVWNIYTDMCLQRIFHTVYPCHESWAERMKMRMASVTPAALTFSFSLSPSSNTYLFTLIPQDTSYEFILITREL